MILFLRNFGMPSNDCSNYLIDYFERKIKGIMCFQDKTRQDKSARDVVEM